jgi:MFS family permease
MIFFFCFLFFSIAVSVFPIGTLVGVLLGAPIAEYLNKKWALIAVLLPQSALWILLAYPSSATMMIIARVLQGLLYGIRISLGQAYVLETTHSKCRGWILSNMSLAIGFGLTVVYVAGALMSWRLVAVTAGVITMIFTPFVLWLPPSPMYFLKR